MGVFITIIILSLVAIVLFKLGNKDAESIKGRIDNALHTEAAYSTESIGGMEFRKSRTGKYSIIIFDTETTGLPKTKTNATESNFDKYPNIVQISWIVFDGNMNFVKAESHIVKQNKPIPIESSHIHGISTEIANNKGIEISKALDQFDKDVSRAQILIAHNMSFDYNVVLSEYFRINKAVYNIRRIPKRCTMKQSIDFCGIQNYNGSLKYPKLEELYDKCYPYSPMDRSKLHNAIVDVAVCAKCLIKLDELGAIK